jgi:hypothetical protein
MKRTVRRWVNYAPGIGHLLSGAIPTIWRDSANGERVPIDITFDDGEPERVYGTGIQEPAHYGWHLRNSACPAIGCLDKEPAQVEPQSEWMEANLDERSHQHHRERHRRTDGCVMYPMCRPEPQEAKGATVEGEWCHGPLPWAVHLRSDGCEGSDCRPVEIRFKETPCLHTCPTHRVKP